MLYFSRKSYFLLHSSSAAAHGVLASMNIQADELKVNQKMQVPWAIVQSQHVLT